MSTIVSKATIIDYLGTEDLEIITKFSNIIESLFHKTEGKLVKNISELNNKITITFSDNSSKTFYNDEFIDALVSGVNSEGISGWIFVKTKVELLALTGNSNKGYYVLKDNIDSNNNGRYGYDGANFYQASKTTKDKVDPLNSEPVNSLGIYTHISERFKHLFQKNTGNFVSQSTTGGTWQNEVSTFTGWGSGIGVVAKFNSIKFNIRGFNSSDLPTKVNVRIRENNQSGNILASRIVDFSEVVEGKLNVHFFNDIDTNTPLWFEFLTDGYVGWFGTVGNGDTTQNAPTFYTTSKNIDNNLDVLFSGSPLNPIQVEFYYAEKDELILTEEGIAYFENNLETKLKPFFERKKNLISESTQNATWQHEVSTFSGWGSGMGVRTPFDTIGLLLRNWSNTDPFTQINVRVRENSSGGSILAEKLLNASDIIDDKLLVRFDSVVNNPNSLYVEYLTNGRVGFYGSPVSEDIGQSSTTTNYITSKSLTSTVGSPVSSHQQKPMFVEFYLSDDSLYQLTTEGIDILKEKLEINGFIPRIILPNKFHAVVGYKHQLFFKGIIEAIDCFGFNIKIKGNLGGKQYPKHYEFTPTEIGDKTFIVEVYNDKNILLNSQSCTVSIFNPLTDIPSLIKFLCEGDSLTAGGQWVGELLRLLTQSGGIIPGLNLPNIEFIGTVDKGNGNRFEGYGGKTWGWYISETTAGDLDVKFLTDVSALSQDDSDLVSLWQDGDGDQWKLETIGTTGVYFSRHNHTSVPPANGVLTHVSGANNTEDIPYTAFEGGAVNPFWNATTDELDIQNYINTNNFGTIDVFVSLLTWNGMSGGRKYASDHQTLINDAKVWIDKLHAQYPNCKVILAGIPLPSQNGGLAANYGDANSSYGNVYDLNQTVFGLNLAYQELANDPSYSSFVHFVNISAQFDSENNFPESLVAVNLDNPKTVIAGTNGVHPMYYNAISRAIFYILHSIL